MSEADLTLLPAAAAFVEARFDGARAIVHGSTVVVELPADVGPDASVLLSQNPGAHMRPVILNTTAESVPAGNWPVGSANPTWAGDPDFYAAGKLGASYDTSDCTTGADLGLTSGSDRGAVACAEDGTIKYLLGAAPFDASMVESVKVDGTTLSIAFDREGTLRLGEVTTRTVDLGSPGNELAFVADGRVPGIRCARRGDHERSDRVVVP